jgi:hypothetical protein
MRKSRELTGCKGDVYQDEKGDRKQEDTVPASHGYNFPMKRRVLKQCITGGGACGGESDQ